MNESFKIIGRCRYIKIVKSKKYLSEDDIYIPVKKNGKLVYIVAQR